MRNATHIIDHVLVLAQLRSHSPFKEYKGAGATKARLGPLQKRVFLLGAPSMDANKHTGDIKMRFWRGHIYFISIGIPISSVA